MRASERTTTIAILNRQRHLTPSCGGITHAAENSWSGKDVRRELDTRNRIREQICQEPTRPAICRKYPINHVFGADERVGGTF